MIPKIIHYCWFGGNPLPKSAIKCIESWKKFLPDYEIKEWNESNYDVHKIPYIHEAYEAKKYAFVSDYARFDILYQYGGIYFDTDVQVIKPMDDIIAEGPFMGREAGAFMTAYGLPEGLAVAPGLALGAEKEMPFYRQVLVAYSDMRFINEDGSYNTHTVVEYITRELLKNGLTDENDNVTKVSDILIYPADVFCPMDHTKSNEVTITDRTVSIHLYDCSWMVKNTFGYKMHILKNKLSKILGPKFVSKVADIIKGR